MNYAGLLRSKFINMINSIQVEDGFVLFKWIIFIVLSLTDFGILLIHECSSDRGLLKLVPVFDHKYWHYSSVKWINGNLFPTWSALLQTNPSFWKLHFIGEDCLPLDLGSYISSTILLDLMSGSVTQWSRSTRENGQNWQKFLLEKSVSDQLVHVNSLKYRKSSFSPQCGATSNRTDLSVFRYLAQYTQDTG